MLVVAAEWNVLQWKANLGNYILDSAEASCNNWALVGSSGRYPYNEGNHLIVELFAYADESGIERNASYCVVAGYVGSPRQWNAFRRDWARVLDEYEVPVFHARDYFQRRNRSKASQNPYLNWTHQKAGSFLITILDVIHRHRIYPIGGGVDVAAFNSFSLDERRYLTGALLALWAAESGKSPKVKFRSPGAPSRPYFSAFKILLFEALQRAPEGSKVHFVFDRQNVYQSGAIQQFEALAHGGFHSGLDAAKLGSIVYTSTVDETPLQVADLHAYAWNRIMTQRAKASEDCAYAWWSISRKRTQVSVANAETMAKEIAYVRSRVEDIGLS